MARLSTIAFTFAGGALGAWSASDSDPFVVAFSAMAWALVAWIACRFIALLGRSVRNGSGSPFVPRADVAHPETPPDIEVDDHLSLEHKRLLQREGW